MQVNQDWREFFASLTTQRVEFLLIGGMAYNYYAPPRTTKDLDIWVCPKRDNLQRLVEALVAFGFVSARTLDLDDLHANARVVMIGRVPHRIDILTRPDGVEWDSAWLRRRMVTYGDVAVPVLSAVDLLATKRAAGRPRDLADVATLEALRNLRD